MASEDYLIEARSLTTHLRCSSQELFGFLRRIIRRKAEQQRRTLLPQALQVCDLIVRRLCLPAPKDNPDPFEG